MEVDVEGKEEVENWSRAKYVWRFLQKIKRKKERVEGWLRGKGACHQTWWPEINAQNLYRWRREPTLVSCPSDLYTSTMVCAHLPYTHKRKTKRKWMNEWMRNNFTLFSSTSPPNNSTSPGHKELSLYKRKLLRVQILALTRLCITVQVAIFLILRILFFAISRMEINKNNIIPMS